MGARIRRERPLQVGALSQDSDVDASVSDEDTSPTAEDVCADGTAARAFRSAETVPVDRQWHAWGREFRPTYLRSDRPMPRLKPPHATEVAE